MTQKMQYVELQSTQRLQPLSAFDPEEAMRQIRELAQRAQRSARVLQVLEDPDVQRHEAAAEAMIASGNFGEGITFAELRRRVKGGLD